MMCLEECVCGNKDYKIILSGYYNRMNQKNYHFQLIKCHACGVKRIYPIPDISKNKETFGGAPKEFAEREKQDIWSYGIVKDAAKYAQCGNFLDIGCSSGKTLDVAKAIGFNPYGIDLCIDAIRFGRGKARNIYFGTIEEVKFKDDFFALIVMNHVLEHMQDPLRFIREADRILQKNGILVINIPTHDSVLAFLMKQNWMALMPHSHVFFYNKATLNSLITKNTTLEQLVISQRRNVEPPSAGLKGRVKVIAAFFACIINKGDQIHAVYKKGIIPP